MRSRRIAAASNNRRGGQPLKTPRTAKRQRRAVRGTVLLDLPDNVLVTILELLQTSFPEPCYARGISSLSHSYALAATCTRLMSLFGATIQALDAQLPVSLLDRGAHLPACISPRHLTRTVVQAGESLKLLRLPRFFFCGSKMKARQLVKSVGRHCPSIRELSLVDEGLLNSPRLASGMVGSQLRKVEICGPGVKVLEALRLSSCMLADLTVLDVDGPSISALETLLEEKGSSLVNLRIGIDLPFLDLIPPVDPDGPVETVLSCLERCAKDMPHLEVLDFEAFMVSPPEELYADVYPDEIERMVARLASFLEHHRDSCTQPPRRSRLKSLRIHGLQLKVSNYLAALKSLLLKTVTVEVECPGASVVFPAKHLNEEPYLRSVQLANSVLDYPNLFGNMLRRLEKVEVSSSLFNMFAWPDGVRSIIMGAAQYVRYLSIRCHMRFAESSWDDTFSACRCIGDLLYVAPRVETLTLPSEIVTYVSAQGFYRMMCLCSNIRVLHLYESGYTNIDSFTGQREPRTGPFVYCLPAFLMGVLGNCRNLRCLYLEELGNLRTSVGRKEVKKNLREALMAVDMLETSLPLLDAGTVRAHVEQWMRPPY